MTKKETIWRHILYSALQKKQAVFTQKKIAEEFSVSLSTVFNALKSPRGLNAVEVTGRFFRLRDAEKLLMIWATCRNLKKEIIYQTSLPYSTKEIEGLMPPKVIFTAFSGYRLRYGSAPADYSEVYVYSDDLKEIKKRFPPCLSGGRQVSVKRKNTYPNLFVLQPDSYLPAFGSIAPDVQIFVDLWNIPQWYAKDFLNSLKEKMNL